MDGWDGVFILTTAVIGEQEDIIMAIDMVTTEDIITDTTGD